MITFYTNNGGLNIMTIRKIYIREVVRDAVRIEVERNRLSRKEFLMSQYIQKHPTTRNVHASGG